MCPRCRNFFRHDHLCPVPRERFKGQPLGLSPDGAIKSREEDHIGGDQMLVGTQKCKCPPGNGHLIGCPMKGNGKNLGHVPGLTSSRPKIPPANPEEVEGLTEEEGSD